MTYEGKKKTRIDIRDQEKPPNDKIPNIYTTFLLKLVVERRQLSRFPAKMTLVNS